MRFNPGKFASIFTHSAGLMAPALLAAAILSVYLAAGAIKSTTSQVAARAENKSEKTVTINKTPIVLSQATQAAQYLTKIAPSVGVATMGDDLIIYATDVNHYAEFIHALSVVQGTLPGVIWEAKDICLGQCDGGKAAQAIIGGYTQVFKAVNQN